MGALHVAGATMAPTAARGGCVGVVSLPAPAPAVGPPPDWAARARPRASLWSLPRPLGLQKASQGVSYVPTPVSISVSISGLAVDVAKLTGLQALRQHLRIPSHP